MFKQAGRHRPTKQKIDDMTSMIPRYQTALRELENELATEQL